MPQNKQISGTNYSDGKSTELYNVSNNKNYAIINNVVEDVTIPAHLPPPATGSSKNDSTPSTPQTTILKGFNFTYIQPWLMDFPLDSNQCANVVNYVNANYNPANYEDTLNYAWSVAYWAEHECDEWHDEDTKWNLRDVQTYNLRPIVNFLSSINNQCANLTCLTKYKVNDLRALNDKYKNNLNAINDYNAMLGTPEQIENNIQHYYKFLIDGVNDNTLIVSENNDIVVYTNVHYDAAKDLAEKNTAVVNAELSAAKSKNVSLVSAINEKEKDYNNKIKNQNDILSTYADKIQGYYTKMDRDYKYKEEKVPLLNTMKNVFFITYYAILIVLFALSYYSKTRYELIWKILGVLFLAVFPFFVYTVELYLYNIGMHMYSFVLNKPYNNDNVDYDPTKGVPYQGNILASDHVKITDGYEKDVIDRTNGIDDLEKANVRALYNPTINSNIDSISSYFGNMFRSFNMNNVVNSLIN
jgi:hypothetical protein